MDFEWLLFLALAIVISVLLKKRYVLQKEFERISRKLEMEMEDFERERSDILSKCNSLEVKLRKAIELYELHLKMNLEFELQRNQVWDLYRTSGLQAGNAQTMLMRELQASVMQLNIYRKKAGEKPVSIHPNLFHIVEEFKKEHGADRPEELRLNV